MKMTLLKAVLIALFMSSTFFVSSVAAAETYKRLVQVIVDDTGALQDEVDPDSYSTARKTLENFVANLSSQYGRDTQVIVISQYGSRNVWSGEARMIRRSSQNKGL